MHTYCESKDGKYRSKSDVETPVSPPIPVSAPTPTAPVSAPSPTAPVSAPSPTAPVSAPSPTTPVSAPSPTTPVKAPVSVASLIGYAYVATYTDATCATFAEAITYPLNICFTSIYGGALRSFIVTATSTSYVSTRFTDYKCSAMEAAETVDYTAACSADKKKFFVQLTNDAPTSKPVAYVR